MPTATFRPWEVTSALVDHVGARPALGQGSFPASFHGGPLGTTGFKWSCFHKAARPINGLLRRCTKIAAPLTFVSRSVWLCGNNSVYVNESTRCARNARGEGA
jgi:hypothetical protein